MRSSRTEIVLRFENTAPGLTAITAGELVPNFVFRDLADYNQLSGIRRAKWGGCRPVVVASNTDRKEVGLCWGVREEGEREREGVW